MKIKIFFLTVLFFFINFYLGTEDYIKFISPNNGWSTSRIINIQGQTSFSVPWINIVYNKIVFMVPVTNGTFSRRFVAFSGINNLYAEFESNDKIYKDSVVFYSKIPSIKLRMVLVWNTDKTHVDLWITEPSGELCKWDHTRTKSGGVLDIGTDYPGYGPQIYTNASPESGNYFIQVHYYGAYADVNQSEAKVYVIINEGSENEIFLVYEASLTKPGLIINVTNINVE